MPDDAPALVVDPAIAAAAAAQNTPTAPWFNGADPELVGHIQNKGWHEKPANEVALEAIKAHREAEKHIGVPADQIIRAPKDASDEAGWKALYARLGKPDSPDGYDLSAVKFSDGTDLSEDFSAFARKTAHELNLPKDAGARLASELAKFIDGADTGAKAEAEAKLAAERAELDKEWGTNKEANLFIAKQAAAKLGVSPEAVAALEQAVGYSQVMRMFQKIGTAIGEDKFISQDGSNNKGILTREQAVARKAELQNDTDWAKRYLNGDTAAAREMTALNVIITGDSGQGYAA